jgi:2-polyprenyl-6-methoxyphenol hydroxylase-like FAD-dependent oxidoreductase
LKVLITGTGIAGAAAAIALHKAGIDAELFEARPADTADTGAFVTITANGQDALAAIDALPALLDTSFPTRRLRFFTPAGTLTGDFPLGRAHPCPRTVTRAALSRELTAEAARRGIPIAYGKRLTAADCSAKGVTAVFADGDHATGDLLVGADGIHSRVRRLIDPGAPEPRHTGITVACGYAACTPDGTTGTGTFDMIYGHRAYFGHTTGPDGCQWWFARLPAPELTVPEPDEPELLREHIATAFDTDATPAARIIRATQGPVTLTTACDIPALPAWHNEQMVLIGDAAHAVSPATTQGASLAVEDAVTLARCLRDIPSVPDALAAYERLRRDRAERIVQTGTDSGANPAPPAPDTRKQGPPAWIFDHHIDWDAPVYAPTTR